MFGSLNDPDPICAVIRNVQTAIRHLYVTSSGQQWIANLCSNVFRPERDIGLSSPRK
jgi:hypothetical protein